MSESGVRSVVDRNGASVPCLVVILEQLGWRVFNIRRRLTRLDLRIHAAKEKDRLTASLETEKGNLQEQLVRFDELLDECAEWIRVRTGIPKRKIRDVAISTAFNEGKNRDDIYAKLGKLDECAQTANLWTALVSQDRDALESVKLLPPIESSTSTLKGGRSKRASGGAKKTRTPKIAAMLVEQAVRNYHKFDGGIVDKMIPPISGRELASRANNVFSARAADRWFVNRFGSKEAYREACLNGTLGKRLAIKEDDFRAFATFDQSEYEVADGDDEDSDASTVKTKGGRRKAGIRQRF